VRKRLLLLAKFRVCEDVQETRTANSLQNYNNTIILYTTCPRKQGSLYISVTLILYSAVPYIPVVLNLFISAFHIQSLNVFMYHLRLIFFFCLSKMYTLFYTCMEFYIIRNYKMIYFMQEKETCTFTIYIIILIYQINQIIYFNVNTE